MASARWTPTRRYCRESSHRSVFKLWLRRKWISGRSVVLRDSPDRLAAVRLHHRQVHGGAHPSSSAVRSAAAPAGVREHMASQFSRAGSVTNQATCASSIAPVAGIDRGEGLRPPQSSAEPSSCGRTGKGSSGRQPLFIPLASWLSHGSPRSDPHFAPTSEPQRRSRQTTPTASNRQRLQRHDATSGFSNLAPARTLVEAGRQ